MRVYEEEVKNIKPYPRNAKKHPETQIEDIAKSIERYGFVQPLVLDKDNVIVIGHGRLEAAKRLGMSTVPCVSVEDLTDEQVRELRIVDNKTNESPWDEALLKIELEGIDLSDFSFEMNFIDDEPEIEVTEIEEIKIEEPKRRTHEGQLWKMGEHRLLVGDATKAESYQRLTGGAEVDLLLTDPPYNVAVAQETNTIHGRTIKNDSMPEKNFYEFLLAFLKSAEGTMKSGSAFYIWHADSTSKTFREALETAGLTLKQNLIWVKSQITLGRQDYQWRHEPCLYGWKEGAAHYFIDSRKKATVFEDMPRLANMNREQLIELVKEMQDGTIATTVIHEDKPIRSDEHPTMKPVKLISRLILNSSREGDIILDPFGGSGTTLIAAEQLGRTCYMMELDPQFADVILARWEKLTGETAEVIDG